MNVSITIHVMLVLVAIYVDECDLNQGRKGTLSFELILKLLNVISN